MSILFARRTKFWTDLTDQMLCPGSEFFYIIFLLSHQKTTKLGNDCRDGEVLLGEWHRYRGACAGQLSPDSSSKGALSRPTFFFVELRRGAGDRKALPQVAGIRR